MERLTKKNRYTVVVKEITSSNGDYNRKRFNNVSPKIIKWLVKNKYSFMLGIANNYVNMPEAENYIEVYKKHRLFAKEHSYIELDKELENKLEKWSK